MDLQEKWRAKESQIVWILLGINFILRFIVAIRPIPYIDGLTITDDSYYSFQIAKNIAAGMGPLYGDSFTNGFQPLYVFLVAPIYLLFPNTLILPIHLALVILSVFDTFTLLILYKYISNLSKLPLTPVFIGLLWIFNPLMITMSTNGLETAMAMFIIMLILYFIQIHKILDAEDNNLKHAALLGLLFGLSLFTRIDCILLCLIIIAGIIYHRFRAKRLNLQLFYKISIICAVAVLVYLPWLIYSYHYTGQFYPVSGRAVRNIALAKVNYQNDIFFYLKMLKDGFVITGIINRIYILQIALLLILLLGKTNLLRFIFAFCKKHFIVVIFFLMLFFTYTLYIFGPYYFGRYFYPSTLVFLFFLTALIDYLLERFKIQTVFRLFLAVMFLIVPHIADKKFYRLYFSTDTTSYGYMNIAIWSNAYFSPGTIIGSTQTGALGYFCPDLKIVNLDGVVSNECFVYLMKKKSVDYIKMKRIDYIFGWEMNYIALTNQQRNFNKEDLIYIKTIEEFKTSLKFQWSLFKVNYGSPPEQPKLDRVFPPVP